MARLPAKSQTKLAKVSGSGDPDLERSLALFRALWEQAATAEPPRRARLQGKITRALARLANKLAPELADQHQAHGSYPLLENGFAGSASSHPRFPAEPILRLYDKDLADQALVALPQAFQFRDVEEFREHLARTLRFNAESTRHRGANYLTSRYFPTGVLHHDLTRFAAASAGRPWLGDALFYLTCRVEKIMAMIAEEVVWPALADGGVARARIAAYVRARVPAWSSQSAADLGAAVVRTYERLGLATATRARLNIRVRQGRLPAFAYILHLEFPEPGMYGFERLLHGPMGRWLLWDRDWIISQLYACEAAGLLAKISEIDRVKQFTTNHTLEQAVEPILSLIRNERP